MAKKETSTEGTPAEKKAPAKKKAPKVEKIDESQFVEVDGQLYNPNDNFGPEDFETSELFEEYRRKVRIWNAKQYAESLKEI